MGKLVVIVSASFDEKDKSYSIYKERFGGNRDFSAWVRQKLVEEADQKNDPKFITEEIYRDIKAIEELQHQVSKNKTRLEQIKQEQDAKVMAVVEEPVKIDREKKIRTFKIVFEAMFKIKDKDKLTKLAEGFFEFMEGNEMERNEAIKKFAESNGLVMPQRREIDL